MPAFPAGSALFHDSAGDEITSEEIPPITHLPKTEPLHRPGKQAGMSGSLSAGGFQQTPPTPDGVPRADQGGLEDEEVPYASDHWRVPQEHIPGAAEDKGGGEEGMEDSRARLYDSTSSAGSSLEPTPATHRRLVSSASVSHERTPLHRPLLRRQKTEHYGGSLGGSDSPPLSPSPQPPPALHPHLHPHPHPHLHQHPHPHPHPHPPPHNPSPNGDGVVNGEVLSHDQLNDRDRTKYIVLPERQSCWPFKLCSCCSCDCRKACKCSCRCPWFFCGGCGRLKKNQPEGDDLDLEVEDDPLRKRCLRAFFNLVYVLLAVIAGVVTYSMIQDLITSMKNPVRSIHYHRVKDYDAPGIAVYPGGAKFIACGHYYNNVVTSKVRLTQLDLVNRNCSYSRLVYEDPHYPNVSRDALVVHGPTSFERREAIFLHFSLEDETRDFFTVSYFVFPGWQQFNSSSAESQAEQLLDYHRYVPTFALSSGLRMWIKLIMSEAYLMDDTKHTEFRVEYSVVKFWDRRPDNETGKHLFFIFFEWKNNIIEQSYLIYTTTPWSIGAGLCGVFLTLHRGYQLAQTSYKRVQKDKKKREIRKQTIRELRRQRTLDAQTSSFDQST